MTSELLKDYDVCEETLRKLYDSRLRLAILDALENGPLRLADLRREVNSNAPNTSSKAKELEEMGILERSDGDYALSDWGEVVLKDLKEGLKLHTTLVKFREYWDTHTVEGVPDEFKHRLGVYSTAELIKPKPDDIDYVDRSFLETFMQTQKRFWGITPVFRDEYIGLIMHAIQAGADVRIILEESIFKKVLGLVPAGAAPMLGSIGNVKFYVLKEKLALGFTIGDGVCTIGFKSRQEPSTYMDMCLESRDEECIRFQEDMFQHFLKKAEPINLYDL